MNVFAFHSYKDFLKTKIQEARGRLTLLAKKAECQASYLLRVVNEEAHLTPDHAHRLCEYWMLDSEEREFFMTQVMFERAGDASYRESLQKRLDGMLKARNNLKTVVDRADVSDVQTLLEYHHDFRVSLAHFLTACESFQTKTNLAARLNMSVSELNEILTYLSQNEMVKVDGYHVTLQKGSGHISKQSPVLPIFLANWRQLAVQKSLKANDQAVHFTNVQTIAKKDIQKLHELSKEFIRNLKMICDESGSEDVVVVNLDLFVP